MKRNHFIFTALFLLSLMSSCSKDNDENNGGGGKETPDERVTTDEIYYANQFADDILSDVYLWKREISAGIKLLDPDTNEDPIKTVNDIRYKENGKEVDRWTMLTNDYEGLTSGMQGVATTYGYDLMLGKFSNTGTYFFIVSYVYENSPTAKAGMKRGDIIISLNGQDITEANYLDALYSSSITLGMGVQTDKGIAKGENMSLTSIRMYENPILATKIFDCAGKKVGYLAYSGFDIESVFKLKEICGEFKEAGVTELILDLRYNGGGYVFTELALASMLAPQANVDNKDIYETEIWNDDYMAYFKSQGEDLNTYFGTAFAIRDTGGNLISIDTKGYNIGLKKIYALISSGTASASESILIGLMPYMDIELIGTNSHGKYCTGMTLAPKDVYVDKNGKDVSPKEIKNWGIYVMINRYADKNGENPCMPDGLTPPLGNEIQDDPMDGYQLGDEQETMLREALLRAGKTDIPPTTRSISGLRYDTKFIPTSPLFGKRIDNSILEKIRK